MLKILLFCLIIVWPNMVMAQKGDDGYNLEFQIYINNTMTLGEVVKAALARSPDNIVVQSKGLNSQALRGRAGSFFSATPEISIQHQNDSLRSDQGLREWQTSIDMPLWLPGQKSAAKNKARMAINETTAYEKLVILEVTGQVREILWELKLGKAALDQALKNLELSQALNKDINKKIAAGNLARRDAFLSQQDVMTRKMELISATGDYIHVAREYSSVTGLDQRPENIEEVIVSDVDGENAPMVELANAQVDYQEAEYREVKNSWSSAPKFSMGLKRERGKLLGRNIDSVGFGLTLPLGAGVHMTSKRAASALELASAERNLQLVQRQHRLHLHEAVHELEICQVQLPLSQSHYQLASENLRLSQKAFDMGQSDLLDLIKIQEQFFQSSAQNTKIIIECKRAVARHNQIKGILLP